MTPEEKALIDARREGFVAAMLRHRVITNPTWVEEAARAFPYPPEPETWTDPATGERWRYRHGAFEILNPDLDNWRVVGLVYLSANLVRTLHALLPPSTEEAPQ